MNPIALETAIGVRNLLVILVMAFVCPSLEASLALAQVPTGVTSTPGAGSLGTTVTTNGPTIQITEGTRPGGGTNLFHSFDQFNVASGDTAQFLNTTPSLLTSNILSRVTGGNPSSIFGTIDTTSYPSANLFFMNPAGIVFGPNATLNVGGSVAFTTADYLRLAEANGSSTGIFHADPTATSLLNSASIAAFGFLSPNPEAIEIQGSKLTVQPDQSLTLVGGNITVQSGMLGISADPPPSASGKQILIASVASPGEVLAENFGQAPNIRGQSFGALGTVQISQNSKIDASGESGGRILVKGGRLLVDDSTISANTKAAKSDAGRRLDPSWLGIGIEIEVAQDAIIDNGSVIETNVEPGADHESGGVRITADRITVSGGPKVRALLNATPSTFLFSGIRSNISRESTAARSGDVSLNATSIQIKDVGQIETKTESTGNAGHITLKTSGDIALDSLATVQSLSEQSSGHAGDIAFSSSQGSVHFSGVSEVTSQTFPDSSGNTGNIKIDAIRGDISLVQSRIFTSANGTGTLGNIQINAHHLSLRETSKIGGDNLSPQTPGNIVITLDGLLTLADGSFINTQADGLANSADLVIKARDVRITGTNSDGIKSGLYTSAFSSGTGGAIDLSASSLTIQNGGTISAETFGTTASATGGSIIVNATDHVTLSNGASITASSTGPADAGSIFINAGHQFEAFDGSSIATQTAKSSGGNIDIRAIDRVRLVNSSISTSVFAEDGTGGNIFIDPNVVILEGSAVTAQAVGGSGGNITFVTPLFLADSASIVSASSEFGPDGKVTARSNLIATIPQLESKATAPQVLLQNRCIALAGGEQSTFILAGRDALPSEPGGWLSSPVAMEHWTGEETEEHVSRLMVQNRGWNRQPPLVMSKDETTVLSLRRLTLPGFLIRTFATDTTGCPA